MKTLSLLLIFHIFSSCYSQHILDNVVSQQDRNTIVNTHNEVRNRIRAGTVPGQPKGVNLKVMKWDNALAATAQNHANTCVFGHRKATDGRWSVGQNIAASYSTTLQKGADWRGIVFSWFNEYKSYRYPGGFSLKTGHYTQVVWADTEYIGCGYAQCETSGQWRSMKFYVCDYGPAGNINNRPPYKTG